jgi:hypothetical protein
MSATPSNSRNLIVLIFVPALLLCGLAPVSAVGSYKPGVKPGDSATYGQVNTSWKSNISPVSPVKDILGTSSITITIQNVVGSKVTARQTFSYPNGTTRSLTLVEDVQSGAGNVSSGIAWIIASSLIAPEPLYESSSASTISQTGQGAYAGSVRTVNIINSTQPEPGGFCKFLRIWDQNTGILVGFVLNYTVSNANYHVSASASAWMTRTSLWVVLERNATLIPSLVFGLAAIISAIGLGCTYSLLRRRRLMESL